jgi:hypothetical protein
MKKSTKNSVKSAFVRIAHQFWKDASGDASSPSSTLSLLHIANIDVIEALTIKIFLFMIKKAIVEDQLWAIPISSILPLMGRRSFSIKS